MGRSVSGQEAGSCGLMGRSLSVSKAALDPKLSSFLAPSIPELVEIAHLPSAHGAVTPGSLGGLGRRKALGEEPSTRATHRLGCAELSWLCAGPHSGQCSPVQGTL